MNLVEFLICAFICALLFTFAIPRQSYTTKLATDTLHFHLQSAQILALTDDRFHTSKSQGARIVQLLPSVESAKLAYQAKNAFWQFQLHLARIYASNSYSVYVDTPRSAITTDFDSRPYRGDMIALDANRKCLSGYTNTNASVQCRDNNLPNVRLGEIFGIKSFEIFMQNNCFERDTGRIFFDFLGMPHCSKTPTSLNSKVQIKLRGNANTQSVCVLQNGKILRNCD